MRTIIAGSRTIHDYREVKKAINNSGWADEITEVVCGGAYGADRLGGWWAEQRNIPMKYFPADWDAHGKAAGPIRNGQMAEYADALILVWDGKSKGSADMKSKAEAGGLKIFEHIVEPTP